LTSQGETGGANTGGRGLRNPFLRKSFTRGSATFFTGDSATDSLITKLTDVFEASASLNNPSFHFTECPS